MHPAKVNRATLRHLTDLPNVGVAMARDLNRIGIHLPEQLCGKSAIGLYHALCKHDGIRHDPCVLDTFISIERFMKGEPPQAWWHYTSERKKRHADI